MTVLFTFTTCSAGHEKNQGDLNFSTVFAGSRLALHRTSPKTSNLVWAFFVLCSNRAGLVIRVSDIRTASVRIRGQPE